MLDAGFALGHRSWVQFGTTSSTSHPAAPRGWLAVCMLVLRVLALLMVAEVSGAAHLGLDIYDLSSGTDHHESHEDCDDEHTDHECPPGCLSCHCAHAAMVLTALPAERLVQAPLAELTQQPFPSRARLLVGSTDLESIYRPPRARS